MASIPGFMMSASTPAVASSSSSASSASSSAAGSVPAAKAKGKAKGKGKAKAAPAPAAGPSEPASLEETTLEKAARLLDVDEKQLRCRILYSAGSAFYDAHREAMFTLKGEDSILSHAIR
eukprot:5564421-Pyramimonas_sp.AAC.1